MTIGPLKVQKNKNQRIIGPESRGPQHSGVSYSKANCTILPNFGFIQDFYISKFDLVLIQKWSRNASDNIKY